MIYRIPMDNFTKRNEIIYSHLGAGGSEDLRAQTYPDLVGIDVQTRWQKPLFP